MPPQSLMKPVAVVAAFSKAWEYGDIDSAMRYVAPDVVYRLYISETAIPWGGEVGGAQALRAAFVRMRQEFEYILYRTFPSVADGNSVRQRVEFMYRHRASGEVLSGRFRMIYEVRDGLLVRADEYHDRAMVEAFMRLFGAG